MSRMFEKSLFPLLALMAGTLLSCQRKAEEPVISPGAGRGQVWFEVSERPMGGETKAAPATRETFTTSPHESFGVVGYAYASGNPSKTKDASGTMEVSYVSDRERWEPATPVKYSFAGNLLEFYAWYPYNTTTVPVTAPATINNTTHPTITYTVPAAVADQKDLMVAKASGVTDSPSTDTPVQLTFSHKLTAVKFSRGVGTTCSSITLEGIFGQGTLDMSTGTWSSLGTDDASYTISNPTFGSADTNGQRLIDEEFTLMLIPQTLPASATLTAETPAGTITASLAGQEWKPGRVVTYRLTDPVISFSVSATQKVRFSPGNLQYQASSGTWRFALHQWDYVGDATYGNVYEGGVKCNNASIGETYTGWIDLFGWGTSGHEFASGYGSAYQPWSTSTSTTAYGPTDDTSAGLTGEYALGDWGVKNMGSGWRTLTEREWVYLLNSRTGDRYCMAMVNDVLGFVIFPDDYSHPSGVTAPASVNKSDASFDSNTWSGDAWTMMESTGCVFLPVTGQRSGTYVQQVLFDGFYWSSSADVDAFSLYFSDGFLNPSNRGGRNKGRSVRLVQDL